MARFLRPLVLLALVAAGGAYWYRTSRPVPLVLTGMVTTNDVIVSPQIAGRITSLAVKEGDQVHADQILAVLDPGELRQDEAFYAATAAGAGSHVQESATTLRFQQRQVQDQIRQAEATLAAVESERAAAQAEQDNAKVSFERAEQMSKQGVVAQAQLDEARTAYRVAQSRITTIERQIEAQRAAVTLARTSLDQVDIRRRQLEGDQKQQAAASAQQAKAGVRLAYADLHAPLDGIVDVVAARVGEVIAPGQPVLTLVNPDDFWVRANVEETYVGAVRVGDTFPVRLPSGEQRDGLVVYRGVEAAFATQRDVSRTKRDIKTFEIRLRVDNRDRRLAVGMTAYVQLPVFR